MKTQILSDDEVEAAGYVKSNDGPHLAVDVPDGHSTITVRTSEGKRITFAFLPSTRNGPPGSIDVAYHDNGTFRMNGGTKIATFDAILFGRGCGSIFDTRKGDSEETKPSIVCVLMQEFNSP